MTAPAAPPSSVSLSRPLAGAWLVVGLLWVIGCLNYLDRTMINTMRGSIVSAIPMSDAQFGELTTVFLWVYAVLSPLGGWCADRFSRSRVILVSLGVWSLVTWATSMAHTFNELLATRALMGISEACYIPAALALISDYHRGSTRSLATGIHMSGIYAGMALGGLGGLMAERFGWSSAFLAFGLFGVAYACFLAFTLRDAPPVEEGTAVMQAPVSPMEALGALAGSRAFWLISLHWGVLGFAGWAFITWMPTFLQEHFELSQKMAGIYATAPMQVAAFLGVLAGGAWADRWSRTHLRGRVLVPVVALILVSPFVLLAGHTEVLVTAVGCLAAFGFARGCSDSNMMPILCQVAEPRHRATGYGVLNFFSCSIGGVASYLGGWLRDRHVGLDTIFAASAAGVLASGLALWLVRPVRHG